MIKSNRQEKHQRGRIFLPTERRIWPLWVYFGLAVLVYALDFVTKKVVARTIELNEKIEIIGNFFLLTSVRNRGAAFGILQGQRWFFILITLVVLSAISWYLQRTYRTGSRLLLVGLALILGGAVGNFYDRALFGEVVDFLQLNFGSYTFPIFNLADSGICIGVALVILDSLLSMKQENNANGSEDRSKEEQAGDKQSGEQTV